MKSSIRIIICVLLAWVSAIPACADTELHSDYFMRIAASSNRTPAERTEAFRRVVEIDSAAIGNPVVFSIVKIHLDRQEFARADSLLTMVEHMDSKDPSVRSRLLQAMGWTSFHRQDYSRAMDCSLRLLKEPKPDSLAYRNAEAYQLMADIFNTINNYAFGERCARHALDLTATLPEKQRVSREIQSCISLSNALLGEGRKKEAFAILKQARELDTDSSYFNAITGTMASLYSSSGDSAMAEAYFREALAKHGSAPNVEAQLLNLVILKLSAGDYAEAGHLMADNDSLLARISNPNLLRGKHQVEAYLLAEQGDMQGAFTALDQALAAADSAHRIEREIYTRQMSAQFEKQLTELEQGNRLRSRLANTVAILGALLVCTGLWFLLRHRRKRRLAEIDGYRAKIDSLSMSLDEMKDASDADMEVVNQRLMGMAMHLARVTESLDKISALASDSTATPDERIKEIRLIMRQLSSEDNLWEMFKTYFEQVNQSFFNNLFTVQPNLTNAEVRMAAFVYLNLTSKEIAAITNRSVRTIDSIKYNLRKKLAISEPTEVYMRKLAMADPATLESLRAACNP